MVDLAQQIASWATAAGVVIAAVGLLLTARQLKIQNRQHRLELGTVYMNRFWTVEEELSMTDRAADPAHYRLLRARYFNLCENEFDAARLGWLDPQQWAVWHSAYVRPALDEKRSKEVDDIGKDGLHSLKACLKQTRSEGWHEPKRCRALKEAPQ